MSDQQALRQPLRAPLQRALQMVVIPDLVKRRTAGAALAEHVLSPAQVSALANASLLSLAALEDKLEQLLAQGWPIDQVYLQAIAQTVRHLGEDWHADRVNFADLTLAVSRFQEWLLRSEERFQKSARPLPGRNRFACLLLGPFNDQHSLGVLMLQAFFRRDGWRLLNTAGLNEARLLNLVRNQHIDLVGLSVATDRRLPQTRQLIEDIRQTSLHRQIQIMVGGPLLRAHPEMAHSLGADLIGSEADAASADAYQHLSNL